jgi:hypothetical protein
VRLIGTNQDVTETRQAEQERQRLLARLYEVLEGQHQRLAVDLHDGHVQSLATAVHDLAHATRSKAALVDCAVTDRLAGERLDPDVRPPCSGSPSRHWPTSSSTPPPGTCGSCWNGRGPR